MNTFYTYAHCKPNGSIFYIGKGLEDRAWSKDNRNIHWKRTVEKHGYTVEILANWETEDEAFDHERLLISCFKDMGIKLVNMTNGGEGSSGYRWTDEQKANFDISGEKNPMFGKRHSQETKDKISAKASQRTVSETAKTKISKAMKNRSFSKSHLEKLKEAGIGNKNGLGGKANSKKCKVDKVIYSSATKAGQALGFSANAIQKRCNSSKFVNFQYI